MAVWFTAGMAAVAVWHCSRKKGQVIEATGAHGNLWHATEHLPYKAESCLCKWTAIRNSGAATHAAAY